MPRRKTIVDTQTPMIPPPDVATYFASDGPLAHIIPGYEVRTGQVALAQRMADAISTNQHLIGEAGTGTGKTLSYLVAIAATGTKAIIATHTKALQQQLWESDIPRLRQMFPEVTAAVLKGRGTYACLLQMDRVQRGEREQDLFRTSAAAQEYQALNDWLVTDGQHGDLDHLPFGISEELREKVTVDGYGCVGRKCPFLRQCYSQQAKERAQEVQIVIVNHSILLLDLFLGKSVGLLPQHPVVVVDEAHQLEDVATTAFGAELTAGRWRVIERKLGHLVTELQQRLSGTHLGELLLDRVASCEAHTSQLTAQAEGWYARVAAEMQDTKVRSLDGLLHESMALAGEALVQSTTALQRTIKHIGEVLKSGTEETDAVNAERWLKIEDLCDRTARWLGVALESPEHDDQPMVRYVECSDGRATRVTLKVKPIRVHDFLGEYLWSQHTVIATSATLATGKPAYRGGDVFTYWRERVGAEESLSCVMPSPFPFKTATRLYVPADGNAFDPTRTKWGDHEGQERYRGRLVEAMAALLEVRRGGAFVLCTSFAMLRYAEGHLKGWLADQVYVQGHAPPAELLRRFKADGSGVLLGTRTFWEGVDVPGAALQMVIIDRLPFGVPDDPLWEAHCRDVGEAWFSDLALPTTLIALKQGLGRLMRRMDDRGVFAILDGRLRSKSYGKWLMAGLPPSPLVGDVKEVQAFFEQMDTHMAQR